MSTTTAAKKPQSRRLDFFSKLEDRIAAVDSHLCVGLDPHPSDLAPLSEDATEVDRCDAAYTFCRTLIDRTVPYAACYKPNSAFFESLGPELGPSTLRRLVRSVPDSVPVLLDAKRGDVGSTSDAYADACYDEERGVGAGGVTLSPLMGWDSVEPFVTGKYSDRGAFLLCKTSNPGSDDILSLKLGDGAAVFERIARLSGEWSDRAAAGEEGPVSPPDSGAPPPPPRLGLVVGATDPTSLSAARSAAGPRTWILAPGVGAQGGDLAAACAAGMNSGGTCMLIPASRGIGRSDDPGAEARRIRDDINDARRAVIAAAASAEASAREGGAKEEEEEEEEEEEAIAPYQREFLELSLSVGALRFGSFVLKSGRTSPYFFNAGMFSSGASLQSLGKAYASAIVSSGELTTGSGSPSFDVVFGPAYKGIPLGALVCSSLYTEFGVDVGFAYNRKEAKDHGEGGALVGAEVGGRRVLVVDDVITAGTAIRESYDALTSVGATTVGVAIALDRAERRSSDDASSAVRAVVRDLGVPVVSIASLPQLRAFLAGRSECGDGALTGVSEYRAEYGV